MPTQGSEPSTSQASTSDDKSTSSKAPPVPPRPNEQFSVQQRYPPYGPYGGAPPFYGYGGPHAHNPYAMSMFSNQLSHPQIDATFQSIQSIVQAFSSISMMLESTYMAVNSSFRAVMDVAEHFIRLKDNLTGALSIFNILATIKWFFRRILHMLNLVNKDQVWNESLARASDAIERGPKSLMEHGNFQSSWPMLMFLGVAIGAPYMIYQFQKPGPTSSKWVTKEDSHYIGEALYDFETKNSTEIPLKAGQKVIIAPKEQQPRISDWFLVATFDGERTGLVPMNYVKIIKYEVVE